MTEDITGRVSFVCTRAAELRKGKEVFVMNQHDAFVLANKEWEDKNGKE